MNMRNYNILNFSQNNYYESPERVVLDKMTKVKLTKAEKKFYQIKSKRIPKK